MDEISRIPGDAACPGCGEGNDPQSLFCCHCGVSLQKRSKRIKTPILVAGILGLALIGVAGYFIFGGFESKLVGKVNGEEITREEFAIRLDRAKRLYEARFGKEFFNEGSGEENLIRLKAQLLEDVIVEKLLLQEAKNGGYASAPDGEIEEQIAAIKKQHGLSDEDFQNRLGIGILEFKEDLKKDWLISQFVEKAVLKDSQGNRDQLFQEWLSTVKSRGRIETYVKFDTSPPIQSVCCKGGGCGGGEKAKSLDPKVEKEAREKGLRYYQTKTNKNGAEARVTDFGCHIQVDIIEKDKVVLSLTYDRGEVQEI